MAVTTKDNPDEHQFEIYVDDALAGAAVYRSRPGLRAFIHTEIESAYEGQGLGGQLIAAALNAAREADESVLPFCPFVNSYIAKHPEYLELVPEDQRSRFGLG
jgi:hypothetical protein